VVAVYGNYDGKDGSSTLQFDLYIGVDRWTTVRADSAETYEALFMAWASWTPVCLVDIDRGTPFVSTVELRTLGSDLYPDITANESMCLVYRVNMGLNMTLFGYPNDTYDRYWRRMPFGPPLKNISTLSPIKEHYNFDVPSPVMQTAMETTSNKTVLNVINMLDKESTHEYKLYLHFADFQNSQLRQFNVCINDQPPFQFSPSYLAADAVSNVHGWYNAKDGVYTVDLVPTAASNLPPMLNAYELYIRIPHVNPKTFPSDFDAIMAIKLEYGIKKNWMGDPCFPTELGWEGVKCINASDSTKRIISLDLSNSNLHGVISKNFTLLTTLKYLNLSGNQLDGPIPEGLCKNEKDSFVFSLDSNRDICNPSTPRKKS
jgi:hypothetical protein